MIEALAKIARRQSRWKESIRLWEEAVKLNPRDASLFMDWAWTLSVLRDFSATEQMIDRGLAIVPDDPELLGNKAYLYQVSGNLVAARAILDGIQFPDSAEMINLSVVQLTLERRYEEAARLLEKKLSAKEVKLPTQGGDRQWLGWLRSLAGEKEGAREAFLQGKAQMELLLREQELFCCRRAGPLRGRPGEQRSRAPGRGASGRIAAGIGGSDVRSQE